LDLVTRIADHLRGHSPYTRNRGPWALVHQEQYAALAEARQVKSRKSHRMILELINRAAG